MRAYVATPGSPPANGSAGGPGILLYEVNPGTGALSRRDFIAHDANPYWLAVAASKTHLYTANEGGASGDKSAGSVTAFRIDPAGGSLVRLNDVSSGGAGPAHVSVHPSGKYAFAANYTGGNFTVIPVNPDGTLGPPTDPVRGDGKAGPDHASSAPPDSFAISGHESAHGHMIQSDPAGRHILGAELGLDRILIWLLDMDTGKLTPNDPAYEALPPGDGPRHFAFHPSGRWLYSIQEEASTVAVYDYDAARGRLSPKQTISTLPKGFTGTNFTSEILVSSDGRFVYGGNRLHDSIAFFSIGADGKLTFVDEVWTRGDYPSMFTFDPSGTYLYSCNQKSDAIATFRRDPRTGSLNFTGQYTPVRAPSCIVFVS